MSFNHSKNETLKFVVFTTIINKWSSPAGGTGMGGNSAETLLPVNRHSNEEGRGSRDGGLLFAQNYFSIYFDIKFTLYSSTFGKSYSW